MADTDIRHAVDHKLAMKSLGEDPERLLVLGPSRAANLLEVIVLVRPTGHRVVIHAMPLRTTFHHLLP